MYVCMYACMYVFQDRVERIAKGGGLALTDALEACVCMYVCMHVCMCFKIG